MDTQKPLGEVAIQLRSGGIEAVDLTASLGPIRALALVSKG